MSTRSTRNATGRWKRIAEVQESSSDSDSEGESRKEVNAKRGKKKPADSSVFKEPGTPPSSSRPARGTRGTQELPSQSSQKRPGRSQSQNTSTVRIKEEGIKEEDDYDFSDARPMTETEMMKTVLYYIMVVKGKNPTRKSDIIKYAMNKQTTEFKTIITTVAKQLRKIFGMQLIGMKTGASGFPEKCGILEATSFIITNCLRQEILAKVTPNQTFASDVIKASLFMILSFSWMMDKTLDEDTIWDMLMKMEFALPLCKRREDLKRFLKSEYVDPLYLIKYQVKETDQGVGMDRYGWGIRAEIEISKYVILKFVAQTMGKRPENFVTHISKISREEIQKINEEDELMKKSSRSRDSASDSLNQSVLEDSVG